ncbi:MAG: hypothetical protein U0Z44_00945 [Kouleothrix sp.]
MRPAYFLELGGMAATPVYDRYALGPGTELGRASDRRARVDPVALPWRTLPGR